MRLIIDVLVALTLVGVLAGVAFHYRAERAQTAQVELTAREVERFHSQVALQAALGTTDLTDFGWPTSIDPEWFGDNLPRNAMLEEGHPLVEVASLADRDLHHPRRLMAETRSTAKFWYNPYTGDIRARVPSDLSDASATKLYNDVNGTALSGLWDHGE